jgi:VanZ family protein
MVAIMGVILFLSHQPNSNFAHLPQFEGIDKIAHIIAYGILAGTFLYGLQSFTHHSGRGNTSIIVVVFCLLFGISDEYHQSFIPGRQVSVWDVAADVVGALLVVGWWLSRQNQKN